MWMNIYETSSGKMLKVVLISSSVLSAAITLTLLTDYVPCMYNGAVSWLKPPYLYVVVNCIIMTIVAFSKLHDDDVSPTLDFVPPPPVESTNFPTPVPEYFKSEDATSNKENEFVMPKSPNSDFPSVSARFSHRRNAKATPQGGRTVLGVSKAKKQDTLENTWKTITEGRAVPISRHLKKSETCREQPSTKHKTMNKSQTFNDTNSAGKLSKEASLSQDELNRRVEAFINKFNHEMRLQRQNSLNQYAQMINPPR